MKTIIEQLNPERKELGELKVAKYEKAKNIYDTLSRDFKEYHDAAEKLLADNSTLNIGVVGQVKAGKSSFLNSLFFGGQNVLPQASTPMTAGLTVLRYCKDRNYFEIEFYNTDEWKAFVEDAKYYDSRILEYKQHSADSFSDEEIARIINLDSKIVSAKELVSRCGDAARRKVQDTSKVEEVDFDNYDNLQSSLQDYVGADGTYTSVVKNLIVNLKDERLEGIQIVDTPGVNDPIVSRENRTRQYLQSSHGVFFLSYSGRFFDSTDTTFLTERIGSQGIGEIVVLASKYDSVLQDVGEKYEDDLKYADKDTQEKLKKQLNNNIQNSNYKGKDPKFDVTSGIGYSIFKKDRATWTRTESHIVEQMRRFYPSHFMKEKDLKETFEALSNIEPIREKYLDGIFKDNKEEIIKNKINAFSSKAKENINKKIEENLRNLQEERESLEKEDLSSLQERKEIQGTLLEETKGEVGSYIERVKKNADKTIRKISNDTKFPEYEIPIKKVSVEIDINWFKTDSYQYKVVDTNSLETKLKKAASAYSEGIRNKWEKEINEIIKDFNEKVNNIIEEALLKNSSLDSRFYHRIIRETIDSIDVSSVLDLKALVDHFEGIVENICRTQTYIPDNEYRKKSQSHKIDEGAEIAIRNIKNSISDNIRDFQQNIKEKMENELNIINDTLSEMQQSFAENLSKNIRKEIDRLERDLAQKEESIKRINDTIQLLENIKL